MGKRSIAQLRKISNSNVMFLVNKTDGSMQLVQKIQQGETALQLYNRITEKAKLQHITKRWVIKRVVTHQSNEEIRRK